MQKVLHFLTFIFTLSHDDLFVEEIQKSISLLLNCLKLKLFKSFYLLMFLIFLWSFLFKMSQRQSQNLSLNDSFILFRAFKRRRKLITQAEQLKITDQAVSLDWAAFFNHHRKWAFISLNVNESRLSALSELFSTSWQFSSFESHLSSLS